LGWAAIRTVLALVALAVVLLPAAAAADEAVAWSQRASMPSKRVWPHLAAATNGKIYAIGGYVADPEYQGAFVASHLVEELDPANNRWRTLRANPLGREYFKVVPADNGRIYAMAEGGAWLPEETGPPLVLDEYDPSSDTWRQRTGPSSDFFSATLVGGRGGKLYLVGGWDDALALPNRVAEYDAAADTWRERALVPNPRYAGFAAQAAGGKVYLLGGVDPDSAESIDRVDEYDPAANRWRTLTTTVAADYGRPFAFGSADGRVYFFDAEGYGHDWLNVLDVSSGEQSWLAFGLPERYGATYVLGAGDELFAIGDGDWEALPTGRVDEGTIPGGAPPASPTATATPTRTATFTRTATATPTRVPPTATLTRTPAGPTATRTAVPPTRTATQTATRTATRTVTPTRTTTMTRTATATRTPVAATPTRSAQESGTPEAQPTSARAAATAAAATATMSARRTALASATAVMATRAAQLRAGTPTGGDREGTPTPVTTSGARAAATQAAGTATRAARQTALASATAVMQTRIAELTATRAVNRTRTAAATATGTPTPTAIATRAPGEPTVAPTATRRPGQPDRYRPTIVYQGNRVSYALDDRVEITCVAADRDSGIAASTCQDAVGPAYTFGLGAVTLKAAATDLSGNAGTGRTTFFVRATYPSLCSVTTELVGRTSLGSSLCSKLTAAEQAVRRRDRVLAARHLQSYSDDLLQQKGRALTERQITQLVSYARALQS
jgi:hypothetical protein